MVERSSLLVLVSGDFEFIVMSDIDIGRNCHVMPCRNANVKGWNHPGGRTPPLLGSLTNVQWSVRLSSQDLSLRFFEISSNKVGAFFPAFAQAPCAGHGEAPLSQYQLDFLATT